MLRGWCRDRGWRRDWSRVGQRLLCSKGFGDGRQRLPCRQFGGFFLVARCPTGLWGRQETSKRAGYCVGRRRLVVTVQVQRRRVRVQRTDHGRRRELSLLVFALFSLESVGVHVVYRGKANAVDVLSTWERGGWVQERAYLFLTASGASMVGRMVRATAHTGWLQFQW